MPDFKPMLAKDAPADLSTLTYPLIVQPKLDGIRCTIVGGKALSRTLKEIPNREIFDYLSRPEFEGLDGEIVVGDPSDPNAMQATTSFVMSKSKTGAPWTFYVFDYAPTSLNGYNAVGMSTPFETRWDMLVDYWHYIAERDRWPQGDDRVELVERSHVSNEFEVYKQETHWIDMGLEGVILRDPSAPYKFGRSGKKGPLLKLKRFIDFEARITSVFELMHNANERQVNALGRTERSTAKDGLVPTGTLGGFICEALDGPHEGQRFRVGTGFTAEQRALWWKTRDCFALDDTPANGGRPVGLVGWVVKIKSFPVGVKDAPRFPVFLGFRDLEVDG